MLQGTIKPYKWLVFSLLLLQILLVMFEFSQQSTISIPPENPEYDGAGPATPSHAPQTHDWQATKQEEQATKEVPAVHEPVITVKNFPQTVLNNLSRFSEVEVVATGYYAGVESTGKSPGHPQYGITYSGVKVRRAANAISTIAADPEVFPIGTMMYIPGYGLGIVADTGSAIKGNKIDLYFDTKEQVYKEWGKKTVKVYLIAKGNGTVTDKMIDHPDEWITNL